MSEVRPTLFHAAAKFLGGEVVRERDGSVRIDLGGWVIYPGTDRVTDRWVMTHAGEERVGPMLSDPATQMYAWAEGLMSDWF